MPLETATYISDLVVTNPANSDGLNQADDHMRLIKAAVKATFPNFTAAALSATQAQLDAAVAAVVTRANATVPAGFVGDFAGTTAPTGWLECDGSSVLRATYPDLFTAIGTTWGAVDGTHFTLPPDRYRRGRAAAGAAIGTLQADQNKTHTHTGTVDPETTDHTHAQQGTFTSGGMSANDPHTHTTTAPANSGVAITGASNFATPQYANNATIGNTSIAHTHNTTISGATGGRSSSHVHTFTTGASGSAEGRPLTAVFMTCIKT